ncbi:MAG: bifunctional transaldolase/phosoglucose isomerase [Solirubrobacteraceae bacterium]
MSATKATDINPKLLALAEAGTSPWLDLLRRSLVEQGELARMVAEDSLKGVTSNPSIFEKAIVGSEDYAEELEAMAREQLDAQEIYERIAIKDVQLACDVLRPVWDGSHGADGFVSLEVAPDMAHDEQRSLEGARSFWQRVSRPNVMIKIPGTPEGVGAIEQAIYEGININVTLLFAVEAYEKVAEAYLRGLERRLAEEKPLNVASVASFFVSRIDTAADQRLEALGRDDLYGKAAIANARRAYRSFESLFSGPRWDGLRHAGAHVQRPLWASTGVKDPRYPDTMYVDELVAAHTVNTMPSATLMAVADHGRVSGPTAQRDPQADLDALAEAGLDLGAITDQLLVDGVNQFEAAMQRLLAGIEEQRQGILTGKPKTIEARLPSELAQPIAARVEAATSEDVARRIWHKDPTLWGGDAQTPEITDRLGWLTVSATMLEHAPELEAFADECREAGYTDAVLLGMGGSSLGPEVLRQSFGEMPRGLRLQVLDSTHPDAIAAVQGSVEIAKTLFIVSSKSGGTVETLSHYHHFRALAGPEQFVVVTDPGSPLEKLAQDDGLRRAFLNPPDLGGRYSVLSYFGLVPAALAGISVEGLLHSCQAAEQNCAHYDSSENNSGLWLGAVLGELARRGHDKLTFVVSEPIESFGLWVEQLIAESTGKQGRGMLPVADEPLGGPEDYGEDRVIIYLRNTDQPSQELDDAVGKLADAGQPTLTLATRGATDLGRIFFLAEFAVAVAGWALEINPFDQPNVQEAKDATKRVLASGALPELGSASDQELGALLLDAAPPHYVAVMGYLAPSAQLDAAIGELRRAIRDKTGAAVTFGYGPRFLHSTGQLHKGGPPNGRFLQLVDTPRTDEDIPGSDYSFATLIAAQSAGDLQTLQAHDLPAERILLEGDPVAAVRDLARRITGLPQGA